MAAVNEETFLQRTAKNVFSGTMAGIAVCLVGHPFDTLKVSPGLDILRGRSLMIWGRRKSRNKNSEAPSPGKKIYKGFLQEKKIEKASSRKKIAKRPSAGEKNLERLSRGKNKFIFEFSSTPQIINGRPHTDLDPQGCRITCVAFPNWIFIARGFNALRGVFRGSLTKKVPSIVLQVTVVFYVQHSDCTF